MAFRHVLKNLCRRGIPVMIGAGVFTRFEGKNSPGEEEKVKFEAPHFETLSYDFMIKQSSVDAVNSATQALTVTYSAIESTSKEYRSLLSSLMSLIEDTLLYEVTDEHHDMIIALRSELQTKKKTLTQLIGYMDYVQKMAEAVTDISYLSGMDNLSISLCERMDDALRQKEQQVRDNNKLEEEYYLLQEKVVKKTETDKISEKPDSSNVPTDDTLD